MGRSMAVNRKNAFIAMGILYLVILALPYIIYVDHPVFLFLEQPLIILLPTLLISYVYRIKTNRDRKEFYGMRQLTPSIILCLTVIAFMLPAIVNVVADLFPVFNQDTYYDEMLFLPGDHDSTAWRVGVFFNTLFFACVFPGICEETLFRGTMLRMSKDAAMPKAALILSNALLFAVFHWNLDQLFYTFAMGIVLTWVVLAAESLLAGIYVHTVYNFIIDLSSSIDLERHGILAEVARIIENMDQIVYAAIAVAVIGVTIRYMEKTKERL